MTPNTIPDVMTLEAVTVLEELDSGRTIPLLMKCISVADDEIYQYVVKLYNDVELHERSLARELFAALLGQFLGLSIPDAAIIYVPEELSDEISESNLRRKIINSSGLNYGSRYLAASFQYEYLPASLNQMAVDIFTFDMLIQNYDRRVERPNMLQTTEDLILIDHEMAFPYASPDMLIGGFEPGVLNRNDIYITNHVLYNELRKRSKVKNIEISFEPFVEKIHSLPTDILDRIEESIPLEWHTEEIGNIKSILLEIKDKSDIFLRSLQEVLA